MSTTFLVKRNAILAYNELRRDYLIDRWVVIATERARRPTDFVKQKSPQNQAGNLEVCPLCTGNEHMTPPATLVYLSADDGTVIKEKDEFELRHKDWLIRCVPNLYPAFAPPKHSDDSSQILCSNNFGYAIGHHEVLIESPRHNEHPAEAPISQLVYVINAIKDRLISLSQKPYVQYVQVFRNHGADAGASQSHAHSQIIAMPFTPSNVCQEQAASKNYYNTHKECIFCEIIKHESTTPRFITGNTHFTVIAPYGSVHPMEFWILPKRHSPNLIDITPVETEAFARILKSSLGALNDLINDPSYNYGFHMALNKGVQNYYHWHLEVYPKLTTWAGFEKSTGMYINTIKPETAASELKKTLIR